MARTSAASSARSEISDLLARADAAREQAAAVDATIEDAVEASLRRTAAAADAALQHNSDVAAATVDKIRRQQERFKLGVLADGISLDDEIEVDARLQQSGALSGLANNKYALIMDKRKSMQEQERLEVAKQASR